MNVALPLCAIPAPALAHCRNCCRYHCRGQEARPDAGSSGHVLARELNEDKARGNELTPLNAKSPKQTSVSAR